MIKYGLKLYSNNTEWFDEAVEGCKSGDFDFVEVYSNSEVAHNYDALEKLKSISVEGIHMGHIDKAGFHEFFLTEEQKPAWKMTKDITDFFGAQRIVVHPAVTHTSETFWENLEKLDDDRIIVESMPVISPYGGGDRIFGSSLESLEEISKKNEICIDFEKSIKASVYYKKDYREFLKEAIDKFKPVYFHISGGNLDNPVDQHTDLWEAEFDIKWIRETLEDYAKDKDVYLVFETPKNGKDLTNDVKNIEYFKNA